MAEMTLGGTPYVRIMFHSEGLWMLSKALVKSIKLMASGVWNSLHFSMMRRRVDICSAQKRLGRNHACCSRNSLSTASRMRFRITWQYTFPGMDRSVTPVQLSHCVRLPFLGIQTTAPFLQSSGTSPDFQTWLQSWYIHLTIHSPPALNISAVALICNASKMRHGSYMPA